MLLVLLPARPRRHEGTECAVDTGIVSNTINKSLPCCRSKKPTIVSVLLTSVHRRVIPFIHAENQETHQCSEHLEVEHRMATPLSFL